MTWLQHLQHISINWRHNSLRSHFNNPKCLGFSASFRKSAEHGGHFPPSIHPSIHPELNWILENFWTLPLNKDVRQNPQFDSKNHQKFSLSDAVPQVWPPQLWAQKLPGRRQKNQEISIQLKEPFEGRPPQGAQKEVREAMLSCKKHPFFTCKFPNILKNCSTCRCKGFQPIKQINQTNRSMDETDPTMGSGAPTKEIHIHPAGQPGHQKSRLIKNETLKPQPMSSLFQSKERRAGFFFVFWFLKLQALDPDNGADW